MFVQRCNNSPAVVRLRLSSHSVFASLFSGQILSQVTERANFHSVVIIGDNNSVLNVLAFHSLIRIFQACYEMSRLLEREPSNASSASSNSSSASLVDPESLFDADHWMSSHSSEDDEEMSQQQQQRRTSSSSSASSTSSSSMLVGPASSYNNLNRHSTDEDEDESDDGSSSISGSGCIDEASPAALLLQQPRQIQVS